MSGSSGVSMHLLPHTLIPLVGRSAMIRRMRHRPET